MEQMFREMDADHDGSIGFEEFVAAMKNNLSEEQLASAEGIKLGAHRHAHVSPSRSPTNH